MLAARGWDVEANGLSGAPPLRVITSSEAHGSMVRALRLLGLGSQAISAQLPVNAEGRLEPRTLAGESRTVHRGQPLIVAASRRHQHRRLRPLRRADPARAGAETWAPVDGAFGLRAAASPAFKQLLRGVERADSWATDGHKWLNVPFDSGFAFVAKAADHCAAPLSEGELFDHDDDARGSQIDWNPDWSRRARGFTAYAALRELGRQGVADLVDRCCKHAAALVAGIGALPGAEILWRPTLNQGLVRFRARGEAAAAADHDQRTDAVIAAILATGEAFFGGTTWRQQRAMRISVCNWRTSAGDVERSVAAVAIAVGRVS